MWSLQSCWLSCFVNALDHVIISLCRQLLFGSEADALQVITTSTSLFLFRYWIVLDQEI